MFPHPNPGKNTLFYGDNLEVLRGKDSEGIPYFPDSSVDLIYLDPPFNSRQNYNVLFAEKDGSRSASQITAFKDTWEWNLEAESNFVDVVERSGKVAEAMLAFRRLLGNTDMLAYLAMMAPRLIELRRVLRGTGSLYLHCDPTASHYLKLLLDSIFGPQMFRNEITWKRTSAHSDSGRFGANTDTIFFYTKGEKWTWNPTFIEHEKKYSDRFRNADADGRAWQDYDLSAKGLSGGGYNYEYKGVEGYWRCPPTTMKQLDDEGKLHFTNKGGIRIKRYLDENQGASVQALWTDIPPINSQAQERLGYPTQKPEALLERILKSSSNEGDVVLDPFCGCGTTIQVAQKLGRSWKGIDITHLAIGLIKGRLDGAFGLAIRKTYEVVGEPKDVAGAEQLALENKHQFQYWALGLCGARPSEGIKKGADRGIDGRMFFEEARSTEWRQIIFSVKGGMNVGVAEVRDLIGVLQREKADIGVYISFAEPTGPMKREAAEAGFYTSADGSRYPRLQLLTIKGLLEGTQHLQRPLHVRDVTFKKAPRSRPTAAQNLNLALTENSE